MAFQISYALLVVVGFQAVNAAVPFDSNPDVQWDNFKKTFQKVYKAGEEASRRMVFEDHVADILQHNLEYDRGIQSFRKGLNQFADMRHDEFARILNRCRDAIVNKTKTFFETSAKLDLPDTVDWRQKGLVTPIKEQGHCASCWAFAATGSLEAQHQMKTGKLVSLSEQNLVDCTIPEGNNGCYGGHAVRAFEYIEKNGGIDTEQSYPYTAQDGTCLYKNGTSGATCKGYVDIPTGDEKALQEAVATIGPISVSIDASQMSFKFYQVGIYNEPNCSREISDHAVLVVGYGTEDGVDYWLLKNSWGTTWGDKGYFKMSRNKNNQCGIATRAVYPLV